MSCLVLLLLMMIPGGWFVVTIYSMVMAFVGLFKLAIMVEDFEWLFNGGNIDVD